MSEAFTKVKDTFFSTPLPHFPDALQEKWQIAILFRRKYLTLPDLPVDELYQKIHDELMLIGETYGPDDTLWNLLFEVYDDISRQIDPERRESQIRLLAKTMQDRYEELQPA